VPTELASAQSPIGPGGTGTPSATRAERRQGNRDVRLTATEGGLERRALTEALVPRGAEPRISSPKVEIRAIVAP
jgi:hypothetical protein